MSNTLTSLLRMPRISAPPPIKFTLYSLILCFAFSQSITAQTCFSGLNAGDEQTWCSGDIAILDGGYATYDDSHTPSPGGTPTVTWTADESGTWYLDGIEQVGATSVSATNFNNSLNGVTGLQQVGFKPDCSDCQFYLYITASSTNGECSDVESQVYLWFDPIQDPVVDVTIDGSTDIDAATEAGNGTVDNSGDVEDGETVDIEIINPLSYTNADQFDDPLVFDYVLTGSDDIDGFPAATTGTLDALNFNQLFNEMTLLNKTCEVATATLTITSRYERNPANNPQPNGDCLNPNPLVIELIVEPRPTIEATFAALDPILVVCENDTDIPVVVTGTPLTMIDYVIDYDDGAPLTGWLTLDENAIDDQTINLNASLAANGEIEVKLTGGFYSDGNPACPVVLTEKIVFQVEALPSLTAELSEADDAVICNVLNGGPTSLDYTLTTDAGPGNYTFEISEFADDDVAAADSYTLTEAFSDNGDGTASWTGTFDLNGGVPAGTVEEYELIVKSISKVGPDPVCVKTNPGATITVEIQAESYAEFGVSVDGAADLLLNDNGGTDDNNPLDITICDGSTVAIDLLAPLTETSTIAGVTSYIQMEVTNNDGVSNVPATGTYYFTQDGFNFSEIFDIDDNLTEASDVTFVFTPYFEDNGSAGLNGDECSGTSLTLNVEVLPAPTVDVAISAPVVCSEEEVIVTITASEPGTAYLILNQGGVPIEVPVTDQNPSSGGSGPFQGFYYSGLLTDEMNQFTVTTFTGSEAPSCSATVNQMVMTAVEERPDAAITIDDDYLCDGDDTFFTLTGSGGTETGYSFHYTINGTAGTATTEGTNASIDVDLENYAPGTYDIIVTSAKNKGGEECETLPVDLMATFIVEEIPTIDDLAAENDNVCSGETYTVVPGSPSADPSAQGGVLWYLITVTDVDGIETSEVVLADGYAGVSGAQENTTGHDQTILVEAKAFYFPDGETPEVTDAATACMSPSTFATITIETVPNATFGGDETICEGEAAELTVTGPINGEVVIDIVDNDGNVLSNLGTVTLDGGGEGAISTGALTETTNFQITMISTDPAGDPVCTRTSTFERTIFVIPTPDAQFDGDRFVDICEGTETSFAISGTPNAVVTVSTDPDSDDDDFTITLDENGEATLETGILTERTRYDLIDVTITGQNNGEPQACSFVPDNRERAVARIDPAPTGALVSNRILCAGETPEIQFNATTRRSDYTGTYTIVVNGVTYTGISDGDVLDLGADAGAEETTTFTLESIVQEDAPACTDFIDGDIYTVEAVVNQVPTASLDVTIEGSSTIVTEGNTPFLATICSGDEVDLSLSGSPSMSNSGDPLFFEIMVMADDAGLTSGEGTYRVDELDAATLSAALGLPAEFVNPDNGSNAELDFMITPYYEYVPDAPIGFTDLGGLDTEGFVDDFAPGNWFSGSGPNSDVSFTGTTTLTLTSGNAAGGFFTSGDDAIATIDVPETGTVSFDYSFLLERFGLFADVVFVDFEGTVTYVFAPSPSFFSGSVSGTGSLSEVIQGGSAMTFLIVGDNTTPFDIESNFTVTNFNFDPAAQPCPGEKIALEIDILPALRADFDLEALTVCENDTPEICITGTPDATVSVFIGGGVFVDVKLDGNGAGCFTPNLGLTEDITYVITGLTTLPPAQECSYTYEATERPTLPVSVTPTPFASFTIDPATVCTGDEDVAAAVTGTPFATVTFEINGVEDDLSLDADGEGSIPLPTVNEGTTPVDVTLELTGVVVVVDEVSCPAPLDQTGTLTVLPLPVGTLTVEGPVCFGEGVGITFTAGTDPIQNPYSIRIKQVGVAGSTRVDDVMSGDLVFTAFESGTYRLTKIFSDGAGCENTGNISEVEVVIEERPDLAAAITGTAGTADIYSEDEFLNSFTAVVCDGGTINTEFSSTNTGLASSEGDPLYVEIEILNNDGLMGLPVGGTLIVPFGDLSFSDILNNAGPGNANITVVMTPFFDKEGDATIGLDECVGLPLTFDITVLPALAIDFDVAKNVDDGEVCEGDLVTIDLVGSPGGVVTFSTQNLETVIRSDDGDAGNDGDPNTIVLDENGEGQIMANAGPDSHGDASVEIMMLQVMTDVGNVSRTCMQMFEPGDLRFDIIINPNPSATISVDPAGPVCNGDIVSVVVTLGEGELDGSYTFKVNGTDYTVDVVDGSAIIIEDEFLEDTDFELTEITNNTTWCTTDYETGEQVASLEVELVPNGDVIAFNIAGDEIANTAVGEQNIEICANETVNLTLAVDEPEAKGDGDVYVSVDYDSPIDFFGLGTTSGTIAMPFEDFDGQFSATYAMISGDPVVVTLEVTYYIENGEDAELNDGDCPGTTDLITITVNPNPKTEDITDMVCSGEDLSSDLNAAITNGVAGATFTYTVSSEDGLTADDRLIASSDPVTGVFTNTTADDKFITYTVTPYGPGGCQGNNFDLVVRVKPEPVITDDLEAEVCSGEYTLCVVELDNEGEHEVAFLEGTEFELINIEYSLEGDEFIVFPNNKDIGDVGDYQFIAFDQFTNLSSEPQTVTYTIEPTSAEGCIGERNTIVVTILPEPVVADFMVKVCSGSSLDLSILDGLTANGVGSSLTFTRTALAITTLRIFDENGVDITLQTTIGGGSVGTPGLTAITDSYLNQGTATLSVFYEVTVNNGDCDPSESFTLEVKVLEETDVELEPLNGHTAICAGNPIKLISNFDGTGTPQYEYSVMESDPGVTIELTPSAAGGEVSVDGSGAGNATIMVMVTDENGCVAMGTRIVSVGESPAEQAIDGFDTPCIDAFSGFSIDATAGNTYAWSLSNPAAGSFTGGITDEAAISITFNNSQGIGPFTVSVTETNPNGCSTTNDLEVTLANDLSANFSFVVSESNPLEVTFDDLSAGGITGYIWDFGDGSAQSNEANPTHVFPDNPTDPGAPVSYEVTLSVGGSCAPFVSTITKTVVINDNSVCDEIELFAGLNFISFDVLPQDVAISSVFADVTGLQSVSSFVGGQGRTYTASNPFFSSLQTIAPGYGYLVVVNDAQTMIVCGEALDEDYKRDLDAGVNYLAYIPQASQSPSAFFADLIDPSDMNLLAAQTFGNNVPGFSQTFNPQVPFFSTMTTMTNGIGYLAILDQAVGGANWRPENPVTESHEFVYGHVEGVDHQSADPVEIINSRGEVIGKLIPNAEGIFLATPVYGSVDRVDGTSIEAFEEDESILFRYRGQVLDPGMTYHGGYTASELNLDFRQEGNDAEIEIRVFPNPVVDQANITLILPEADHVGLLLMDAVGRQVRQLLPEQPVTAGNLTVSWDDANDLPAGIYYIVPVRKGQPLNKLTQRVVKQ
ncbi:PKD-like domain-containing protein [Neolewinella agarilytica]|uniref:PKD domain-containing protein n=1 Tax=Neolewinella agarilytica TaxID=478744 RepID=A0A1H9J1R8_9BACT|nr:PKD-like domain-containing protein [Neolewinella agarilytica]SEQ80804.1 hypothetical protein SAMN05444359_11653 [Neolewinella agarilytica]